MNLNDALDALRHTLHLDPSPEAWRALTRTLDHLQHPDDLRVALDYLLAHLDAWPPTLRTAPEPWLRRVLDFQTEPRWDIVRALQLPLHDLPHDLELRLTATDILKPISHLTFAAIFTPRRQVRLRTEHLAHVLYHPNAANLRSLTIADHHLNSEGAAILIEAPATRNLTHLAIRHCRVQDKAAQHLAVTSALSNLSHLDLTGNLISDTGAEALAAATHLTHLTRLDLAANRILAPGADALAFAPHLPKPISQPWRLNQPPLLLTLLPEHRPLSLLPGQTLALGRSHLDDLLLHDLSIAEHHLDLHLPDTPRAVPTFSALPHAASPRLNNALTRSGTLLPNDQLRLGRYTLTHAE